MTESERRATFERNFIQIRLESVSRLLNEFNFSGIANRILQIMLVVFYKWCINYRLLFKNCQPSACSRMANILTWDNITGLNPVCETLTWINSWNMHQAYSEWLKGVLRIMILTCDIKIVPLKKLLRFIHIAFFDFPMNGKFSCRIEIKTRNSRLF